MRIIRILIVLVMCCLVLFPRYALSKITAEAVLGDYWEDPLFGEAAESHTVQIEILNGKIWPEVISVVRSEIVRFVFLNKSKESHLFAFAEDVDQLLFDDKFQQFIEDEIYHSKKESNSDPRSHSHSSSSVDDAQAIVKLLSQRPTVFVKPDDMKEILIRFVEPLTIEIRCVIGGHQDNVVKGILKVLDHE